MLLRFQDPVKLKTKRVVYEENYYARDSGTLEQLKELSTKRQAIEESINGSSKITPAIAREMAGGITSPILQDLQKIERYLPLLENLVKCVEEEKHNPQIIQWTTDLAIRWTSPLSGSSGRLFTGPKYFRVDDLRYELGMTFFLYGALLRELALEVLSTDIVEAGTLFRRASGIYQHLAENVLSPLKPSLPPDRSPEATVSLASIMSIICLAEAQAVTIRKAEEKATSGSLLAKLHYGVVQFLEEAALLLRTSTADWNDVSDKLRKFIATCSVLHESRSQRYIAAEYKKVESFGVAIGVLRYSLSRVQPLRPGEETWKVPFRQELDDLQNMLRKCDNENDFIWREKPPRVDELPVLEGRQIVQPIAYQPFCLDREFMRPMVHSEDYQAMLDIAIAEARLGLAEGGIPIGAAMFDGEGNLLGRGHNRRVQENDPSVHAETDAFRKAGRQRSYRNTIMVTTLAPCWYCSGLVRQFNIGTLVVGESVNFQGGAQWLRENGVKVIDLHSSECVDLLANYVVDNPAIWNEDIGQD